MSALRRCWQPKRKRINSRATENFHIQSSRRTASGKEVGAEGMLALEAADGALDSRCTGTPSIWSCETYVKTGKMMPADGLEQLRPFDAISSAPLAIPASGITFSLWDS